MSGSILALPAAAAAVSPGRLLLAPFGGAGCTAELPVGISHATGALGSREGSSAALVAASVPADCIGAGGSLLGVLPSASAGFHS